MCLYKIRTLNGKSLIKGINYGNKEFISTKIY